MVELIYSNTLDHSGSILKKANNFILDLVANNHLDCSKKEVYPLLNISPQTCSKYQLWAIRFNDDFRKYYEPHSGYNLYQIWVLSIIADFRENNRNRRDSQFIEEILKPNLPFYSVNPAPNHVSFLETFNHAITNIIRSSKAA